MLDKIKSQKYKAFIFIVEAICMILELCASRVLSPYFGNSNIVWTSVIGIILLSSSLGNYIGGKIADKDRLKENLRFIIFMSALFVLLIPLIQKGLLEYIAKIFSNIKLGAIIGTLAMFFVFSLFLGCVNPIIIKLSLKNLETAGEVTGKVYAFATIGGIVGTFLGGFVLVPNFGSVQILYVLASILFILAFLLNIKKSFKVSFIYFSVVIIAITMLIYSIYSNTIKAGLILNGQDKISASFDTQYGRVIIRNMYYNNEHEPVMETLFRPDDFRLSVGIFVYCR